MIIPAKWATKFQGIARKAGIELQSPWVCGLWHLLYVHDRRSSPLQLSSDAVGKSSCVDFELHRLLKGNLCAGDFEIHSLLETTGKSSCWDSKIHRLLTENLCYSDSEKHRRSHPSGYHVGLMRTVGSGPSIPQDLPGKPVQTRPRSPARSSRNISAVGRCPLQTQYTTLSGPTQVCDCLMHLLCQKRSVAGPC